MLTFNMPLSTAGVGFARNCLQSPVLGVKVHTSFSAGSTKRLLKVVFGAPAECQDSHKLFSRQYWGYMFTQTINLCPTGRNPENGEKNINDSTICAAFRGKKVCMF